MKVLPILFNTEMVRNLLADRKTVTRRVVKPQLEDACPACRHIHANYEYDGDVVYCARCGEPLNIKPPYRPGDILYVRETFRIDYLSNIIGTGRVHYKADGSFADIRFAPNRYDMMRRAQLKPGWRPNENMPREAARIFLRVTDVRVERLTAMSAEDALKEGCVPADASDIWTARDNFHELWDRTIKLADRDKYRWVADPWVWVISFERREKPQEEDDVDGEKAVL